MRPVRSFTNGTPTRDGTGIRSGFRPWALSLAALVALDILLLARARAAPPSPGNAPAAEVTANDCLLTVRVLEALRKDESLDPLNLGLTVRQNVATLWGPVPSADLGRRAEEKVRQVPGIGKVINELHVQQPEEPWIASPRQATPKPAAPAAEPADPAPAFVASILMGLPGSRPLLPGKQMPGRVADFFPPRTPPGSGSETSLAAAGQAPAPALRETIGSMPPIHISAHPPMLVEEPPATLLPPRALADLLPIVQRLLQADARFRHLRPEIRDGTVHLHGAVYSWEDLHACARVISLVAGVQRVELEDVKTVGMTPN